MTQPKKPARSSSARKRATTAKSSSRSTSSARSASPRAKAAASKGRTTRGTSSKGSPAKAPARAGAKPTARKPAARRPASPQDVLANLGALRERLLSSITLSPDRLQETVDDAVRRGRMTRRDAEELLTSLVAAGRQQTEALLSDLEQLLGRAGVRERATRGGDAVLRRVDRARRRAGAPGFPVSNYDDLNASQITKRLDDLTPAQLRKVRDHERRNDNRKSILQAIERKLR